MEKTDNKLKYNLTKREIEILKKIIEGKNNIQIGKELYLSYHTIKIHVASILRKLNVKNRIQAAIKGVNENLTEECDNVEMKKIL